jgi:hypothetical protein
MGFALGHPRRVSAGGIAYRVLNRANRRDAEKVPGLLKMTSTKFAGATANVTRRRRDVRDGAGETPVFSPAPSPPPLPSHIHPLLGRARNVVGDAVDCVCSSLGCACGIECAP